MTIEIKGISKKIQDHVIRFCHKINIRDGIINIKIVNSPILHIHSVQNYYDIEIPKENYIFRCIVLIATKQRNEELEFTIKENISLKQLGFMVDVSRNSVLKVSTCKRLIEIIAYMGYTSFQLYMEDTYEIPSEPYFGYLRGPYSISELLEIEEYANDLGIEFIPCIQTLAHLGNFLKWDIERIQEVKDIDDILLSGNPHTYDLIEKMFQSLSKLKTREINIGMDEAHLIGLGKYLNSHGYEDRSKIMLEHLEKVIAIASRYGFHCRMWSDMFFQLLSRERNYDGKLEITKENFEKISSLTQKVKLIYWDYYQTNQKAYDEKWKKHYKLSNNLGFAGGAWKWIGFTPDNQFSLEIAKPAFDSCKKNRINDVVITAWGDNGGETSIFSILPSLLAWSELNFTGNYISLEENFKTLFSTDLNDFMLIDGINYLPSRLKNSSGINPNRYLFYQDILCPLFDKHTLYDKDSRYLMELSNRITGKLNNVSEWDYIFKVQAYMCEFLSLKLVITRDLRKYYNLKNKNKLMSIIKDIERLQSYLDEFYKLYSDQWLRENKVFGLDVIDLRIGGLSYRLKRAKNRLLAYCEGDISCIDELEVDILPYKQLDYSNDKIAITANQWHYIVSASSVNIT